jgi:hypothetical protein
VGRAVGGIDQSLAVERDASSHSISVFLSNFVATFVFPLVEELDSKHQNMDLANYQRHKIH